MNDVLIIGGGAAGLGAALYSARFSLNTTVIAKDFGGTGNIAHKVDNWIGEPGITGPELMEKFVTHVKEYNVPMIAATVEKVEKKGEGFVVYAGKEKYESKTIIFANGMIHRKLGIPGEEKYSGKGVHYCYTCDGPLYGGKTIAVVGGSDSAALGALFMAGYAEKVYVIYRKEKLRAEPISSEKVYSMKDKIEVIHNTNVTEVYGETFVTGVKTDTGKDIKLDGVFVEIGHIPLNELAKGIGVEVDAHGFIKVDKDHQTNIKGVFAAGDITDSTSLKQFITSASGGSIAAQSVYHYFKKGEK
mgnify:CR=1 FL=1|jgi:thioredoxin reductase (NADPH)